MIHNSKDKGASLKEMKAKAAKVKDAIWLQLCEKMATERFGADKMVAWRKEFGAIWFMHIEGENETVEKLMVMRPVDRHILSFASTKLEDDGLYTYLEQCMRDCKLDGDEEILDDDDYFIPCAHKFNKIMEGKKASFLKG